LHNTAIIPACFVQHLMRVRQHRKRGNVSADITGSVYTSRHIIRCEHKQYSIVIYMDNITNNNIRKCFILTK